VNRFHQIAERVAHTGRRVLAHRPLASAILESLATSVAAVMVGLTIGHVTSGDREAGFAFAMAGIVALLWGWAERRARTAYDLGWKSGVDAVKNAAHDLLAEVQSIGEAAATAQRAQEEEAGERRD